MGDKRKQRSWRRDAAEEGGCCLLEFFAVASCFAALALIPLLVR